MTRYRRGPSLLILLVAALLGVVYVSAWGMFEHFFKKPGANGIEAIEKEIANAEKAGAVPAALHRKYGEALMDAKDYFRASLEFKKSLAIEPFQRDVKFQCGIALALGAVRPPPEGKVATDPNELHDFLKDLVLSEAKLAVELFERAELQRYLSEDRFAALAKEAKSQAMD